MKTEQYNLEFNFSVTETQFFDEDGNVAAFTYHIDYQPVPNLLIRLQSKMMRFVDNQQIKQVLNMNARELCDQTQDQLAAAHYATEHLDEPHIVVCSGYNPTFIPFLSSIINYYNQHGKLPIEIKQDGDINLIITEKSNVDEIPGGTQQG